MVSEALSEAYILLGKHAPRPPLQMLCAMHTANYTLRAQQSSLHAPFFISGSTPAFCTIELTRNNFCDVLLY